MSNAARDAILDRLLGILERKDYQTRRTSVSLRAISPSGVEHLIQVIEKSVRRAGARRSDLAVELAGTADLRSQSYLCSGDWPAKLLARMAHAESFQTEASKRRHQLASRMPASGKSAAEIVAQTNALARRFYAIAFGRTVSAEHRFHDLDESRHPDEAKCWRMACEAQEELARCDPYHALLQLD